MSSYNLDYLRKISNNDSAFISEILNTFIESATEVVQYISDTNSESQYEQLSRVIHKFIPSLNFVGVKGLEEDLNTLEIYLSKKQNLDEIPQRMEKAKEKINQVIKEIKEVQMQ
ncbi:MAG: hypothetical protein GVY19_04710 [Bacteroidetes bacterium]|jgi:HPt (histidine-containing phosphotransfer) domain-containing protein|nr:hypothetical protein [Bacteroidota bacterium]